jgi:hypothetical protein
MEFRLNEYRQGVTDEELLMDVRRVSELVGDRYMSYKLYKSEGKYSENTFRNRFGSWLNVLTKLGLRIERTNEDMKRITDKMMLDDLKRVSELLGNEVVTSMDYYDHGSYANPTITERFGNWSNFITCAGLTQTAYIAKISDQELFDEIERLWISLGKQPTTTEMKKGISKYSLDTFMRRFGGWRNALSAFLEYVNSSGDELPKAESMDNLPLQAVEEKDLADSSSKVFLKRTSRNINLKMRFTVLQRDNFSCRACGASPAKNSEVELHIDHILPWSKGGETELKNLQTLCSKCNLGKSNHESF